MTNYTKSTDFAVKDVLLTGNPNKLVKGSEVDVEFSNMELADATNVKKTGSTGSAVMPVGTTAQRDASPAVGYTRVNTTSGTLEWWDGTIWTSANGGDAYDLEVTTATAGQTVITTASSFVVGSHTLMVYLNGLLVNKTSDYTETTTNSFTFNSGLTAGDEVVAQIWRTNIATSGDALTVSYTPAGTGAVATTAQAKLRESVSVKDFGAKLDGTTDDSVAVQAAFTYANGTGLRVVFPGSACKLASSISLNNYSNFVVDFGKCAVSYTSGAGVYAYNATQAGNIEFVGGSHTGTSNLNHFVKTAGSASAQATTYPTIPAENQWSRQLRFNVNAISGFATVFDLQNFTREIWIGGYITGNTTALKLTGKVVNLYATKGTVLYSSVASSQALLIRGDSGDATYRYAEGIFLAECILDTVGTTADVRDVYLLDLSGTQIKTTSGGIALDITKGVCPITRNIFVSRSLMQGKLVIGSGLASQFLFDVHGSDISFSDVSGTAIDIQANTKGVSILGASFFNGISTPRMFAVGASCVNITFSGLNADASSYTNAPTIDSTSQAGVNWLDKHAAVLVQQSGSQTINVAWTKVSLQNKVFDTDSWFDATTNYRFQPTVSGYFTFTGQVQINSTTVGLAVDLYKNGASTGYIVGTGISGVLNSTVMVSKTLFLNGSTDYVELYAYASSATASNTGLVTQMSVAYAGK